MSDSTSTIPIEDGIHGLIFDCDGTLADSMPTHYEAWLTTLGRHGVPFPEDLFYSFGGISTPEIIRKLNRKFGASMDPEAVAEEKEELARRLLRNVKPVPIVVRTVRKYLGKLPIAVASGGDLPTVMNTLRALKMEDVFDAIVTADQIEHPKPAPDTFLEAARRLGVPPASCQVFEDTDTGLEAVHRAGMVPTDIRKWHKDGKQ